MEKNKAGPKEPSITVQRRKEVLAEIEEYGPYSLPVKELCSKWNCSRQTIYNDVYFWIDKIDIKKIDSEGKKLLHTVRQGIKIAEQLRKRGSDKDRLKAIEVGVKSAEAFTRLMEQYGFKEKIAEKVHHTVESFTFKMEEIDGNKHPMETKPKAKKGVGHSDGSPNH